jgi:AsmA protein
LAAPFRILLILLLALLLLVGAAIGFLLTLDVENYRDDIVRGAREATGLDLRLDGPLELTFFPEFSLEVTDAAADWTDASSEPLAEIRRVHLAMPVLPVLLGRGARVEAVVLDGVALDLRVDGTGADNWSMPAGGEEGDDPEPPAAATVDAVPADPGGEMETDVRLELDIERLELTDLRVRYRDARDGTDVDLSGLDVVGTSTDGGFDLALGGRLDAKDGPRIAFDGEIAGDEALQRLEIRSLTADVELPDWQRALPLRASGEILRDASQAELRNVRLEAGELVALLAGTIGGDAGQDIALDIEIAPSDLRALLQRSGEPPATADPAALTRLAGRLGLRGSTRDLRLDPLVLELDDLILAGTARIRNGERPFVAFDLDAGRLDLSPYLPTDAEQAPEGTGGAMVDEAPLGLEALGEFDLDGVLTASTIVAPGLTISESRFEIDADRGRVDLKLSATDVLGGVIAADVDVDVDRDVPEIGLRLDAEGIDGGRLAPDAGFTGAIDLDGRLDAAGASSAALARDLRGRFDLVGTPGTLDVRALRAGILPLARLLGEGERVAAWPDELGYRSLTGAWIIADGTGDQRLDLRIDNMTVDAAGGIDLVDGAFDFRTGARFAASAPRTFDVPRDLEGLRLPARCAGRLGDPGNPCGFDQQATGELVSEIVAGRAGDKLRERLSEQIPDELRGPADALLRGLFGQPQRPQPQPPQQPQETPP